MNMIEQISAIIVLLVLVGYMILVYFLAQSKKDRQWLFYLVLYLPQVAGLLSLFLMALVAPSVIIWILLVLILAERLMWGMTLYEVAGDEKVVWYCIIFLVPVFGWVFYRLVKLA